ncbi:MAG: LysR family transcriptional regulator [Pseudomonadota bacterium]
MKYTSLNWNDLKVALAIGRTGSIARGASSLGVDQSTMGRRLNTLEAEVGTVLFTRSKTGLTPTEAGRALIERATQVEFRINRLAEDLSEDDSGPSGLVRVLGHPWMLQRLAARAFPRLLDNNPALDIRLIAWPSQEHELLETTVSLWFQETPRSGEFAIKLGPVPYAVYVGRQVDADTAPWLSQFDEHNPRCDAIRFWEKARGNDRRRLRITSTDDNALIDAVRAGVGKALLPMCLAEGDRDLVRVTAGAPDMEPVLHLHTHPDTVQAHRVQAVIRCVRESFKPCFSHATESDAVTVA